MNLMAALQPTITPRDYQIDACDALWGYFERATGNPLVLMPTGTGKSVVLGEFLRRMMWAFPWTRAMAVTHVETLISQNHAKIRELWPTAPAGIYSAGLNRRDTHTQITFAGIQSVFDRAHLFGWIDVLFIDEAHLVSPNDETMYRAFINALLQVNPKLKIVGLTATDWRLRLGRLTDGGIFTDVAIDMTTTEAWNWFIDCGYLSPLTSKPTSFSISADGVGTQGGEFILSQLQRAVDKESITRAAVEEMVHLAAQRKQWLIFATGVEHCEHISEMLGEYGIDSVAIHSKAKDAAGRLAAFKRGDVRAAVSMNKLTTGVDAPGIDFIGVLRHTKSSALWVQMLGRGTRPLYASGYDLSTVNGRLAAIAAGPKQDCLVADFARNTERLGPINAPVVSEAPNKKKGSGGGGMAIVKICPACEEYVAPAVRLCRCGHEFEFGIKIEATASTAEVMTRDPAPDPIVEIIDVEQVTYHVIGGRAGRRTALRVSYYAPGLLRKYEEFISFEMGGARPRNWWMERVPPEGRNHMPVPSTSQDAKQLAQWLRIPKRVRVWTNATKPKVIGYEYE